MAIRVRKLARELDRSPADVLGLLLAIGFPRYRSPDDMLPDDLIDRVKRANRDGVRPVPVQVLETDKPATHANREPQRPERDVMARLVPGVVPVDKKPLPKAVRAPTLPPATASNAPPPGVAVQDWPERPSVFALRGPEKAEAGASRTTSPAEGGRITGGKAEAMQMDAPSLHDERMALVAEREALRQERETLAAERAAVAERRIQLEAALQETIQAADAHRAAAEARLVEPRPDFTKFPTFAELLTARGLRGRDELERAVAALASHRLLGDTLAILAVTDVPAIERLLRERITLTQSESATTPAGSAAVVVGPQRAEVQDAPDLQRALTRLGERLLLHGLRRVVVIGGRPTFQKSLRDGVDPRIEIRFGPAIARGRIEAESDVQRTDLVVVWALAIEPAAREIYASSRAVLVEVAQPDLPSFLAAIDVALDTL